MAHASSLDAESLRLVLDSLDDFSKASLSDEKLLDFDEKDIFPEELVRAIGSEELGIQLVFIPEEFGGMGGGAFDVYRVCELLGGLDLAIATGVLATFLGSDPILFGGSEEQKAKWLGRIAEEGLLMAYGATEPEAGSDLGALRTTATPVDARLRSPPSLALLSRIAFTAPQFISAKTTSEAEPPICSPMLAPARV